MAMVVMMALSFVVRVEGPVVWIVQMVVNPLCERHPMVVVVVVVVMFVPVVNRFGGFPGRHGRRYELRHWSSQGAGDCEQEG